jgi:hypothetical protein
MKHLGLTVFFWLFIAFVFGQKPDTAQVNLEHQKFMTMVNANREQSYITFANGVGNLEPLIFEGKLSPSYFFSGQGRRWALMINPQVMIRMLDKSSFPIRNPSYKIYVTYYRDIKFWDDTFLKKLFYKNALWFASLAHHSNGQDGTFYSPDTTRNVNFEDGNFATNFLELGVSSYKLEKLSANYFSIREIKAWLEFHPPRWSIEELDDQYGFYRVYVKAGLIGPMRKRKNDSVNRWLQRSSLEIKTGWIMGKMGGTAALDGTKRLVFDFTYKYYPQWFDEIAFFLRFYRGQDYYNIYFLDDTLTQLSVGITSNIMNFKRAVKYLK